MRFASCLKTQSVQSDAAAADDDDDDDDDD